MTCKRCQHQTCKRFGYFGKRRIQRWRCQSCKATFCEPHAKVGNHYLAPERVTQILSMMLEGVSIRAIARLTGVDKNTILSLLETAGERCAKVWDTNIRGIHTRLVQADEIWGYVGCHQKRLRADAPATWGDQYTWFALDSETKMVISYHIGRRDSNSAHTFIRDLGQRVEGRFQLTTDALRWYSPAVDEYLGAQCDYAMLIKLFGSRDISGPDWYGTTSQVIGTVPKVMNGRPDPRYISTSHIERSNLTLRMQLRRFTRLTNAHSRKLENLKHAVTLFMCWYNFVRVHSTLRVTPAMAAGISSRIWDLGELIA